MTVMEMLASAAVWLLDSVARVLVGMIVLHLIGVRFIP